MAPLYHLIRQCCWKDVWRQHFGSRKSFTMLLLCCASCHNGELLVMAIAKTRAQSSVYPTYPEHLVKLYPECPTRTCIRVIIAKIQLSRKTRITMLPKRPTLYIYAVSFRKQAFSELRCTVSPCRIYLPWMYLVSLNKRVGSVVVVNLSEPQFPYLQGGTVAISALHCFSSGFLRWWTI